MSDKWPGRPTLNFDRLENTAVRLEEEDVSRIKAAAKAAGLSSNVWLRNAILRALKAGQPEGVRPEAALSGGVSLARNGTGTTR